jgi:Fe2+ or Zn2+ uptake regulation protein
MQAATVDREVERRLRERGVRFTRRRRAVLAALSRADGPRSAAELHQELEGEVPLSSLYRSLAVLEDVGVLEPHHGARGLTRYELAEWLAGHHHHLVCVQCGAVDDVRLSPDLEAKLEDLVLAVTDGAGFEGRGHSLEIDGRCARCR